MTESLDKLLYAENQRPPLQPAPEQDVDDDDLDLLPAARRRPIGPGRMLLLAGVLGCASFAGGALVQKQHDKGPTTTSRTGNGTGRAAGLGGAAGTFGTPPTGGAPILDGAGGAPTAAAPAVIGQVVSATATTLTVRNFGGKTVTVHLGEGVSVERTSTIAPGTLRTGQPVVVVGTTAADGSVTATTVTSRG